MADRASQRFYARWSWNRHQSNRIKNAISGGGPTHQTAGKNNNRIVLDPVTVLYSKAHKFNLTDWRPQSLTDQLPIKTHSWYGTRHYPTRILLHHRTAQPPGAGRYI